MPLLLQNLGCDVVGRPAYSFLAITLAFNFSGQSKITYFAVHLLVDQNIPQFQIPVDYALLVDIDHGLDDLADVYSGLELCQSFSSF